MSAPKKPDFTLGVWIEAGVNAQLAHEGLVRLLGFIAGGILDEKEKIVIVCAPWNRHELSKGIRHLPNNAGVRFEIRSPLRTIPPAIFRHHRARNARPPKSDRKKGLFLWLKEARKDVTSWTFSSSSFLELLFKLILLSPLVVLLGLLFLPFYLSSPIIKRGIVLVHSVKSHLKNVLDGNLEKAYERAFRRMAKSANAYGDIDCWFTLSPFSNKHAHLLEKPLVSLFADFVPITCPSGFSGDLVKNLRRNFNSVEPKISHFITISEHVKDQHMLTGFNITEKKITVIPHAPIDLGGVLTRVLQNKSETKKPAADLIRKFCATRKFRQSFEHDPDYKNLVVPYLQDFPFEHVKYIFVSTQNRAYKNTLRVVQAVEKLIREKYVSIKIIMSGEIGYNTNSPLAVYVAENKLHHDVLAIPRVPGDVHAALYHLASVAVHASFFEGGVGNFPFYEAVSVGTPILSARAPNTIEDIDCEEYEEYLFDPYDINQLAEKIHYVLNNRELVIKEQRAIYDRRLGQRTWTDVADSYFGVFKSCARAGQ